MKNKLWKGSLPLKLTLDFLIWLFSLLFCIGLCLHFVFLGVDGQWLEKIGEDRTTNPKDMQAQYLVLRERVNLELLPRLVGREGLTSDKVLDFSFYLKQDPKVQAQVKSKDWFKQYRGKEFPLEPALPEEGTANIYRSNVQNLVGQQKKLEELDSSFNWVLILDESSVWRLYPRSFFYHNTIQENSRTDLLINENRLDEVSWLALAYDSKRAIQYLGIDPEASWFGKTWQALNQIHLHQDIHPLAWIALYYGEKIVFFTWLFFFLAVFSLALRMYQAGYCIQHRRVPVDKHDDPILPELEGESSPLQHPVSPASDEVFEATEYRLMKVLTVKLSRIDRIPLDLFIGLGLVVILLWISFFILGGNGLISIRYLPSITLISMICGAIFWGTVFLTLLVGLLLAIVRRMRFSQLCAPSLIGRITYWIFSKVRDILSPLGLGSRVGLILVAISVIGVLALMRQSFFIPFFLSLIVLLGIFLGIRDVNWLRRRLRELSQGTFSPAKEEKEPKKTSGQGYGRFLFSSTAREKGHRLYYKECREMAEIIDTLSNQMQEVLDRQKQADHLRNELITNVSHDLRTPLTSILTAADLLKKPDLTEEERTKQLEILAQKSRRLAILQADLLEVTSASHRDLPLELQEIPCLDFLLQMGGEFVSSLSMRRLGLILRETDDAGDEVEYRFGQTVGSEKISELEKCIEEGEQETEAKASPDGEAVDPIEPLLGQKANTHHQTPILWVDPEKFQRVLENLLSNCCKYALPASRIYLTVTTEKDQVKFSLKNYSARPLHLRADELLEKFVREERSRHSEGSGLGLTIAQTLVKRQGGDLQISVLDDLFTVSFSLPRAGAGALNQANS